MMKHPKFLGLFVLALSLVLIGSCGKDDPCEQSTFYLDSDGDGEGDSTKPQKACKQPDNHVANAKDPDDTNADVFSGCTKVTYYLDNDDDNYGGSNGSIELCDGVAPPDKYVANSGDCNDSNPDIHPGAEELPNDGVDSDCDDAYESIIWTGPDVVFSKNKFDDWTNAQFQDKITDKVTFTRQNDNEYLINLAWWEQNIGNAPIEDFDNLISDLQWDFWDSDLTIPGSDVSGYNPGGGTRGVRWAIIGTNNPNDAWDNFQLYGTLGDNTHFYSFHNICSMIFFLNTGQQINEVVDDFNINYGDNITSDFVSTKEYLIGKTLGVWLEEEDIYFTLTFTAWTQAIESDGKVSYTRSSPQ